MSWEFVPFSPVDVLAQSGLRERLAGASGLDECLWLGGCYLRDEYGIRTGFLCFHPSLVSGVSPDDVDAGPQSWSTVRIPPQHEGSYETRVDVEERDLVELIAEVRECGDPALGARIDQLAGSDRSRRVYVFQRDGVAVGVLSIVAPELSSPDRDKADRLRHEATTLFRRFCAEFNAELLAAQQAARRFESEVGKTSDAESVFRSTVEKAVSLTGATSGAILEVDRRAGVLRFRWACSLWRDWSPGILNQTLVLNASLAGVAARSGRRQSIGNRRSETGFEARSWSERVKSTMAVPIVFQGLCIGVLCLDHEAENHFFDVDGLGVELLADKAAPYVAGILQAESLGRVRSADRLAELAMQAWSTALQELKASLGVDYAAVQVIRSDGGYVETVAATGGVPYAWVQSSRRMLWEGDICCEVIRERVAEVVAGPDDRVDGFAFEAFGRSSCLRAWVPVYARRDETGVTRALPVAARQREIGGLAENSRRVRWRLDLPADADPVGVVEAGFIDTEANSGRFGEEEMKRLFSECAGLAERIVTSSADSALAAVCAEVVRSTAAVWTSIHGRPRVNDGAFDLLVSAQEPDGEAVWDSWATVDRNARSLKKFLDDRFEDASFSMGMLRDMERQWPEIADAGIGSFAIHRLPQGILFAGFPPTREPNRYEREFVTLMAGEARRQIVRAQRVREMDSQQRMLTAAESLGEWLDRTGEIGPYWRQLAALAGRTFLAEPVTVFERPAGAATWNEVAFFGRDQTGRANACVGDRERISTLNDLHGAAEPAAGRCSAGGTDEEWVAVPLSGEPQVFEAGTRAGVDAVMFLHLEKGFPSVDSLSAQVKSLGVAVGRSFAAHRQKTTARKRSEVLREIARLNPEDGEEAVYRQGVRGFSLLTGFRGCAYFFLQEYRGQQQLIMEHHDYGHGLMFEEGHDVRRRVPLIRVDAPHRDIRDLDGRVLVRMHSLSGAGIRENPATSLFPFREGAELLIAYMRPGWEDRDEACDIHHIVIARDAGTGDDPDEWEFIGNLALFLHGGIRLSREWSRHVLDSRLDALFLFAEERARGVSGSVEELAEVIPDATIAVYSLRRESGTDVAKLEAFARARDDAPRPAKRIEIADGDWLWTAIHGNLAASEFPDQTYSNAQEWLVGENDNAPRLMVVPFSDSISTKAQGVVLCNKASSAAKGLTPLEVDLVRVAASKLGDYFTRLNREDQLRLDGALVGHAVKAPLHGILASRTEAQLCLARTPPDLRGVEVYLNDIGELVSMADEQVLSSLGLHSTTSVVSLGQLVKALVHRMRLAARRRNVAIDLAPSLFDCPSLVVNASMLETVLVALLDNAIKYSYPGHRIRANMWSFDYGYRLEIANFGNGILVRDAEKIYSPAEQGQGRIRGAYMRGSGLGLYGAKGLCEKLGIRLWHSSRYTGKSDAERARGANYETQFNVDFPPSMFEPRASG